MPKDTEPVASELIQDWVDDMQQEYKKAHEGTPQKTAAFVLMHLGELVARIAREVEKKEGGR